MTQRQLSTKVVCPCQLSHVFRLWSKCILGVLLWPCLRPGFAPSIAVAIDFGRQLTAGLQAGLWEPNSPTR